MEDQKPHDLIPKIVDLPVIQIFGFDGKDGFEFHKK